MTKTHVRSIVISSLVLSVLVLFINCSNSFQSVRSSKSSSALAAFDVENCVISNLRTQSKLLGTRSLFDESKFIINEENDEAYVSVVSQECLKNEELKSRSNFTKRMNLQKGPADQSLWVSKISPSDLSKDMSAIQEEIEEDPCVIGVSPNREYKLTYKANDFNDTFLSEQQHLESVKFFDSLGQLYNEDSGILEEAGRPKVRVAVIDTGVFYDHPDLTDNIYRAGNGVGIDANTIGPDYPEGAVFDGIDVDTQVSHGTHVSGIIAARGANGLGVTGLAPNSVEILPINIFFTLDNVAGVVSDSATLIKGILFAIEQNADVINLSLGGRLEDPALLAVLQSAVNAGIFIVAAASNEGRELNDNFLVYPAAYAKDIQGMISVGSIDVLGRQRSIFSNYNPEYVDIAAPGAYGEVDGEILGIFSSVFDQAYGALAGTSQATPMLTAAAALAEALIRQNGSLITPAQMETLLLASAEKRTGLANQFKDGNLLDLQRLATFVNANYPETGQVPENSICQE